MQYRIQKRKFSGDIIERGVKNEEGKITWSPFLAVMVNKKEADPIIDKILKFLENESK